MMTFLLRCSYDLIWACTRAAGIIQTCSVSVSLLIEVKYRGRVTWASALGSPCRHAVDKHI